MRTGSRRLEALDGGRPHAAAEDLLSDALAGRIDRREALRTLGWLGVGAASAQAALGLSALGLSGCGPVAAAPRADRLRFVCAVQQLTDPALTTWVEASNLFRNTLEFLTEVDADNVTQPYLAKSWSPSEDLKTWRFDLRDNVRWSNGDPFTTRDVAFNLNRWIAKDSASVNRTTFAAISGVEVVDDHALIIHLNRAVCALPEQLYAFTCPIVHHRFEVEGGDWPKNPVGTGPYALGEYQVGRRASFRRRDGYWGRPARTAQIDYIDLGTDVATHVAALAAGQADVLYRVTIGELDLVAKIPHARLLKAQAAQTLVMRMQADKPPFDDIRVRRALIAAADREAMLHFAYRGQGVLGEDHHVAPFQPDYAVRPKRVRDVAMAKRLLAEAGHKDGIDLTLTLGNTQGRWEQDAAQVLQQNCAEAGIRLKLNVVPPAQYWSIWDKTPFGLTYWAHRPLGVMTLDLAYRTGSVWNESRFADKAFDAALDEAMAVLDPRDRAKAMAKCEAILQDRAVMLQPFWAEKFTAVSDRVRGHRAHPSDYFRMDQVGLAA